MDRMCVLLYSKYSPMSTKLMTALSECPIDLEATVGLNTVCIDNQDVRKRLLKNGKIEISVVPCILIVYRSGGVEKYEGDAAFQWIDESVSKYSKRVPDQESLPVEPTPQPQVHIAPQPQKKEVRNKHPPVIIEQEYDENDEDEDEDEDEDVEYIPVPQPPRKTKPVRKTKKETTSVEDLGFEPYEEKEFPVAEDKVKNSIKGNDLLSAAAAMQKERDAGEPKTKKKYGE